MIPPSGRRSEPPLLARIARTLFTHDAVGNLVDVNEPGGPCAPRFYLAWNERGVVWRVRHDVPPVLADRLAAIVAAQPASDDLDHPPGCTAPICAALAEHAPVATDLDGGIEYTFPDPLDAQGGAVIVTTDRAGIFERWLPQWQHYATIGLPLVAVLVDGAAVSVCACVRFPGDATEAGVETHQAFRGRGHAVEVTAAWAQAVRAHGIFPLYGTSWRNRASQRVAAKLGLIRVAGSLSIV
jgi:hypothetical protein